jgi:predicted metal-dependent peptidase
LVGGGGTDLRTGFAEAQRGPSRADVIVALTDGQTPWPEARPAARTVVGLFSRPHPVDEHYRPEAPPAWARVVTVG